MYKVLCDGIAIYDLRDDALVLIDPKIDLEINKAGSFVFKIPPQHPQYDLPKKMLSCIQVFQDDREVFNGRITESKIDFYNRKQLSCEGQLAYLNDSIQRPAEYHNVTVRGYLEILIAEHNKQVSKDKQFELGIVTVTDNNDSLYRYTNYNSTMREIKEDLIDDLGGYLRVRNVNGSMILDYITDYENINTQTIEFGENLLDFSRNTDVTDIATAIIPLGAKLEDSPIKALEQRLTIESVNQGSDCLVSAEAAAAYGYIVKTVTWDAVKTPEMLLYKGRKYLSDYQFGEMVLEVKAVDLHCTDKQVEQFKLGDKIRVRSSVHGLDRVFPLSKMTIHINRPSSNSFTLGTAITTRLTAKSNEIQSTASKAVETIPVPSSIVKQAVDQATALITAATHGHVVTTANEQLIMDTDNVETAQKVWRWNVNGFGYSSDGYDGPYRSAITMDGWIVGERIAANSINAEKIDINYRNTVIKEIEDAEETARTDAEGYTNEQLKNYYTKSEVETSIKNTKDSILLLAQETAEQFVEGKLKNYSTSAQIKVKTDAIESEVNKKLNSSEWSTKLRQSATDVSIAWNNISKYVQFSNGELRIYDSAVESSQKLRSVFNSDGEHFYRDGYYVGKVGTNQWTSDTSHKGLVFDLEASGKYMAFAQRPNSATSGYTTMLCFSRANSIYDEYGLHLGCNLYCHGYEFHNMRVAGAAVKYNNTWYNGYTGIIPICTEISIQSEGNGTVSWSYSTSKLRVANGLIVGYWS